jgi:hypothetical protein
VVAEPGIDLGGLDLVRDALAEIFEDDVHADTEAANILTAMLDVPVDRLLPDHCELEPFVLHVRGQLHPTKGIRLLHLVELEGIAATAHLLTAFPAVDGIANPPDIGAGLLLEDPPLFPNSFLGMAVVLPPTIANQVPTATRTDTSTFRARKSLSG